MGDKAVLNISGERSELGELYHSGYKYFHGFYEGKEMEGTEKFPHTYMILGKEPLKCKWEQHTNTLTTDVYIYKISCKKEEVTFAKVYRIESFYKYFPKCGKEIQVVNNE